METANNPGDCWPLPNRTMLFYFGEVLGAMNRQAHVTHRFLAGLLNILIDKCAEADVQTKSYRSVNKRQSVLRIPAMNGLPSNWSRNG
jgi:hypothetical protein